MAASLDSWRSKLNTKYSKQDIDNWDVKLKAALKLLKQQPSNRKCFDCGVDDVTWASPKLGIFICVACSDVHRAAGAHITCVKNFNTYLWGPDEVALMTAVGNTRGRTLYGEDLVNSSAEKATKVKYCTRKYGDSKVQQVVAREVIEAKTNAEKSLDASSDVKRQQLPPSPTAQTPSNRGFFDDFMPEPSTVATVATAKRQLGATTNMERLSIFSEQPQVESHSRPDFFDDFFEHVSTGATSMDGQDGYRSSSQPESVEASVHAAPKALPSPTLLQVRADAKIASVSNTRVDGGQNSLEDFLTFCNPPGPELDTLAVIVADDDLFAGWESWN